MDNAMKEFLDRAQAEEELKKQALLEKIKQAQERIDNKDKAIKELQFERDLIFNNFLNIINEDLRLSSFNLFAGFNSDLLWKAWRWGNHKDIVDRDLKNGDIDDKDYKNYKVCFDLTTRTVKEKFFGDMKDDVEFKEIIMFWNAGYEFTYIYKDQEISILVPIFHADENDFYYALAEYKASYREDEYSRGYICNGLDYKEVASKLQAWMKCQGWIKKETK